MHIGVKPNYVTEKQDYSCKKKVHPENEYLYIEKK